MELGKLIIITLTTPIIGCMLLAFYLWAKDKKNKKDVDF